MMASSTPSTGNSASATTTVTETQDGNEETLRLKLKKGAEKKKIQWTEDTVDNEGEQEFHHTFFIAITVFENSSSEMIFFIHLF